MADEPMKAAVADQLKDPDSAKFRKVAIVRGSVCGEINAKNSMGGYVGYKRFMVVDDASAIDDDTYKFEELWDQVCSKNPTKPPSPTSWSDARLKD
jgi:hypothetical protein